MTRVVITGAKGRMGAALLRAAREVSGLVVTAEIDEGQQLRPALAQADVVVDFTSHAATADFARACAEHGTAMVIGTTGHSESERAEITRLLAGKVPVVWSANFSTGVNALFWLTRKAAEILGPSYDLEIVEMHHRLKKDAPSGTARSLAEILAAVRSQKLSEAGRHGREGLVGERTSSEIGIHAVRGGDVVGDHTVIFAGLGERLELTHKASSRDTFAVGALRAALWVHGKPPGLYDMQNVLGLHA